MKVHRTALSAMLLLTSGNVATARYMEPATGRFLTDDPLSRAPVPPSPHQPVPWAFYGEAALRNPQRLNRCAYALNNPLRYTDPYGLLADLPLRAVVVPGSAYDDGNFVRATQHLVAAATTWRKLANIPIRLTERTSLCSADSSFLNISDPVSAINKVGKSGRLTVLFTDQVLAPGGGILRGRGILFPAHAYTPAATDPGLRYRGILLGNKARPQDNTLAHEIGHILLGPDHPESGLMELGVPSPETLSSEDAAKARAALDRLVLP